jgi:A/G-specific adenine glycosylase
LTEDFKVDSVKIVNYNTDQKKLLKWYDQYKRDLPWRASKDPYKIWISEVMLQQTTVTAVIPFFRKFIQKFPTVQKLASANLEDVYEYWAGLGYYSRARNIHKSAQILSQTGFPQTYSELIELPGFGPYTSRAVSSICFNEKTGVLDGNVIRILSRKYGLDLAWWETKSRQHLQRISDQLAQTDRVSDLNQALMELGATVCTPKKVLCFMCPWKSTCISLQENKIEQRPLKKQRPEFEIWNWTFEVNTLKNKKKIFLVENNETPFLKKNWLPPSKAIKVSKPPKKYDFKHSVTKYEIYVQITRPKSNKKAMNGKWIELTNLQKINPTSLMKKIAVNYLKKE